MGDMVSVTDKVQNAIAAAVENIFVPGTEMEVLFKPAFFF